MVSHHPAKFGGHIVVVVFNLSRGIARPCDSKTFRHF